MNTMHPRSLLFIIIGFLPITTHAQGAQALPSAKKALEILATFEQINERHYKIVHITSGTFQTSQGFRADQVARVTFFAPGSGDRNKTIRGRQIRHCDMQWSPTYGWYLQATKTDSRGVYLEISSEYKGRVFVR